eukprot:8288958-Heterocapsa_arctica.AAC.1
MQRHLKQTDTVKFQTSLDAWTQSPDICEEYEQAMKTADPDRLWSLLNTGIRDIAWSCYQQDPTTSISRTSQTNRDLRQPQHQERTEIARMKPPQSTDINMRM